VSFQDRVAALPEPGERAPAVTVRADGDVVTVQFDHPAARNALSPRMMVAFAGIVGTLSADPPRAVLIGGVGPAFCAGGDLAAVQEHLLGAGAAGEMQAFMRDACDGLAALPSLVIAAVEGAALGGGAELLTACDLVYAAPDAKIGFIQAAMGVSPGFGGAARLVRQVGSRRAVDLLTRARPIDAAEALRLGVVDEIVVDPWARALARGNEFASLPPHAAAAIKPLVRRILEGEDDAEAAAFVRLWGGPEHVAALDRFRRR
jgi:enoyl-CoA hydratase/carnithine racemase